MTLLLDTHTFLWSLSGSRQLRPDVLAEIEDPGNEVYLSAVSAWEISIKVGLGKLDAPGDVGAWLSPALTRAGFVLLPIQLQHVTAVEHLPHHHRDPFDRLLIAQAIAEDLVIATADRRFAAYPVRLLRY